MELIKISEIKEYEDGFRKDFGDIEELADSIARVQQIQPVVLDDNNYIIAGRRRLRAFIHLGWSEIGFIRRSGLTPVQKREIEIEENVRRKPFDWPEEVLAVEELYKLKQEQYGQRIQGSSSGGYGLKDASSDLHRAIGSIHLDLELAKGIREYPELIDETTKSAAIRRYKRLKGKALRERAAVLKAEKDGEFLDVIDPEINKPVFKNTINEPQQVRAKKVGFKGNGIIYQGDSRLITRNLPDKSVDVIVTDPPFGIGLHKEGEATGGKKLGSQQGSIYNDDPFEVLDMLSDVFTQCGRLLKPGGHVYCFFHHNWYAEIRAILEKSFLNMAKGQHVDTTPCVWIKNTPGIGDPNDRWVPAYEPFFHLSTGRPLVKPQPFNYLQIPTVPAQKKKHPTAKPTMLLREIIQASAVKGEVVFDPFAGSGSTLVAAVESGCKFVGIELDENYFSTCVDSVSLTIGALEMDSLKTDEELEDA